MSVLKKQLLEGAVAPIGLALIAAAVVFVTIPDYGLTWDEGTYCRAGNFHAAWFAHPSLNRMSYWAVCHEHPPLGSLLGGFLRHLFNIRLRLMDPIHAFRLQALIYVFIAVFATFSLTRMQYGFWISCLAAVSFFLLPRMFSDSHLGALDYPSTALWVLAAWMFWKGLSQRRWFFAATVMTGCAMLTKINGFALYALLIGWFVIIKWRELFIRDSAGPSRVRRNALIAAAALVGIPVLTFFVGWPWLWTSPVARTVGFLRAQFEHETMSTFYLGAVTQSPPWHYPFLMSALTIPVVTLAALPLGFLALKDRTKGRFTLFISANALTPLVLVAASKAKYDGVRLFMQSFPFLCILAAMGIAELSRILRKTALRNWFGYGYALLFAISVWCSTVLYHPYQDSYYNEIAGGAAKADRNFEVEYWGGAFKGAIPWIQAHPDATFWTPVGRDVLGWYVLMGDPLAGIKITEDPVGADYLLLLMRKGEKGFVWSYLREKKPIYSVTVRGAQLVNIYEVR